MQDGGQIAFAFPAGEKIGEDNVALLGIEPKNDGQVCDLRGFSGDLFFIVHSNGMLMRLYPIMERFATPIKKARSFERTEQCRGWDLPAP